MALRDQLQEDLATVFFRREDFAVLHEVAGRSIPVIVDEDQLQQYALKGLPGFYEADRLLYIQERDLEGLRLEEGRFLLFDGAQYAISKVSTMDGLVELSLKGVRG